jgi:hypothetical protein
VRCRPSCDRQASRPVAHQLADDCRGSVGGSHATGQRHRSSECRIASYLDQGGALRAPWADASARPQLWQGLAGARRLNREVAADQRGPLGMPSGAAMVRLPRHKIVPLAAAMSRSLPAVASHAIGYAEPGHGIHSPGISAYRGRRDDNRLAGPQPEPGRASDFGTLDGC